MFEGFHLLLWLPKVSCVVMIALKLNSLYIDEEGGCSKGKMKIVRKIYIKTYWYIEKKKPILSVIK